MLRRAFTVLTIIVMGVLLMSFGAKKKTTIFMIGDSTMANKDISGGKQERGWGMALQCYFDDDIVIDNHAVNGRSSKSFINEGRWDSVLAHIQPGDYVVIQFGHNDEKPKADRHTDPGSTFDYNLRRFVRETREHGGTPILLNAVVRRNFFKRIPVNNDDEQLRNTVGTTVQSKEEGDTLYDTHGMYIVAPRDVAHEMHVAFVDANAITHRLEQGLGREKSRKLHMWYQPGEEPSIPNGRQDNTHYNIYGAHVVARLLADAITAEVPLLSRYRVNADITVDKQGRGDFINLQQAVNSIKGNKAVTIQLLGGTWQRPKTPKNSRITYIMRMGATWQ